MAFCPPGGQIGENILLSAPRVGRKTVVASEEGRALAHYQGGPYALSKTSPSCLVGFLATPGGDRLEEKASYMPSSGGRKTVGLVFGCGGSVRWLDGPPPLFFQGTKTSLVSSELSAHPGARLEEKPPI